ncbi:inner membrane protein, translocase protein [Actinomyces sp. Chiba101]|uniref:membrane protein insertase YidC n=1 Tax=Actinomyces TaxID=1654 RepID=UPI000974E750|nr:MULTISPECIES: membrane protein insertase YidC [Actinomyces]BAW94240.1 inner membrane protein, translocase protein [Actinomyces sp. Chiba101]GAV95199.1 inner membrane protein translocase protein [Actinomyces denticolens]SUU12982.1 Stage III sporulation protein J [Actinomyces denticolens]
MDTILWPIKVAIAWVMVHIHQALVAIGLPDGAGIAWVLSIVGLTIVVRLLIMPLFVRQIRAQRGMQLMQPELKALQEKYKGKKDPASRQRQQEEMMALYRKHGTNPMASCLPIIVQMPIFFALFRVLASLQDVADGSYSRGSIGPLTADLAEQVQDSTVLGAPLSSSFMQANGNLTVQIVSVILILAMSVSQWYTMAQITTKNMPDSSKTDDNPMMRTQKIMMTVMPIVFAVTGINFQIGVLIYWLVSNLWTMGQQFYTIHRMPAPGSEAERNYRAKQNAKRAAKGLPSLEEEEAAKRLAEAEAAGRTGGQRVQPVRKNRQKRSSLPATAEEAYAAASGSGEGVSDDDSASSASSASTKHGGLTEQEIARRRYERKARARQQAAAKRKAQAKKQRKNH